MARRNPDFYLELFDDYFVTADKYEFQLNDGYNDEAEEKPNVIGHFSKIQSLVKYLAQLELKKAKINTVKDLLDKMDEIEHKIDKMFPEFKVIQR